MPSNVMSCRLGAWLVLGSLVASAVLGQPTAPIAEPPRGASSDLETPCADGVVRDDSTVETGWGWVPSTRAGLYVQEYPVASFPARRFTSVCVCWLRTRNDASLDFEVVFFESEDDQPAETPFAAVPARAEGVPQGVIGQFTTVPLTVEIPPTSRIDDAIYIGVRWNPSADQFFFVCADTTPETPATRVWFIDNRAEDWDATDRTRDPLFLAHRAILVRPVPAATFQVDVPTVGVVGSVVFSLALALAAIVGLRRQGG